MLEPGAALLHYRVVEKIGEGGMGAVWKAVDTTLDREVAIKVLPAAFAADAERLARFEREAKTLASLNHPGIAAVHSVHESGGVRFLAMEYVPGEDLEARIRRGALPVDETVEIARQIAEALEAAHERGVIHRDLKPANVRLTPDGKAKVLDLGLAKALEIGRTSGAGAASPSMSPTLTSAGTLAGMILGTAAYMAPEQAKGLPVDRRADIWAFGVVVWEMLVGRPMFAGETVPETLGLVMLREIDLGALPASTPPRLRALLERCLERDPRKRLRDIGEARIAFERIAGGDAGEQPAARSEWVTRRSGWIPAVVTGAVCILATLGVVRWLRPEIPDAPLRKLDLAADGMRTSWYLTPLLSPDGDRIAFRTATGIWIRDLEETAPRRIAEVSDNGAMFWSPDGRWLGYEDAKKLWRVASKGGSPIAVCDLPGTGQLIGGAWRKDGTIALASWRGAMYTVPADGGRPSELFPHDPGRAIDYHHPSWLPDGRLLYLVHVNLGEAAPSGDGSTVSAGAESSRLEICDGKERQAIVWDLPGDVVSPTFDPVSKCLLYSRAEPSPGLWARRVSPDSLLPSGEEFLLFPGARGYSLGGDGSLVYAESAEDEGPERDLVWTDRTGSVREIAVPAQRGLAEPAFAPDGKSLVLSADAGEGRDLFLVDLARGVPSRFTFDDARESAPQWWPGSDRIVYGLREGRLHAVVSREAEGSGSPKVLVQGGQFELDSDLFSISPDGKRLIFAIDDAGPRRLRIAEIGPDGTVEEARRFFSGEAEPSVGDARISPDGSLLAYMSTDSGQPEIYLARFPGGEGRWQVSGDGGRQPRWAARSGELFFIAGSGPSDRAMAVATVESGPRVSVGLPSRLFPLDAANRFVGGDEGFDVTSDGKALLMVRSSVTGGTGSGRMILVQNWRRALER